jgi:hypothetical protein
MKNEKCEYSGRYLQGEEKFTDEIYNRKKRKGRSRDWHCEIEFIITSSKVLLAPDLGTGIEGSSFVVEGSGHVVDRRIDAQSGLGTRETCSNLLKTNSRGCGCQCVDLGARPNCMVLISTDTAATCSGSNCSKNDVQ